MTRPRAAKHRPKVKSRDIATGIAIAVPARMIGEVINQKEFAMARKRAKRRAQAEISPTLDSTGARAAPGPEPQRLKLEGPFEEQVRKSFRAKPPKRGKIKGR